MALERVVIVAFPGVEILDVTGPASVLSSATRLLGGARGYRVEVAAERAGPLTTSSGLTLVATRALADVRQPLDALMVAGGLEDALAGARRLAPLLARASKRARRTVSVCSGAFLLARAGLLRGRRVATHWAGCEALARLHPECTVLPDPIYVRDRNVWTSAGVTAGLDLSLALVEQDHGARLALEVARWLVMYLRRPGGQSQFSAPLALQRAQTGTLPDLVAWMVTNVGADLSVTALARRAGMSARNFGRVFHRETGGTPAAFVERLRMDAARRALELSTQSTKEIAASCGFGTVETMHRAFQRALATTPLQYRARFAMRASRRA